MRERDLGEWSKPSTESLSVFLRRWLREAAAPRIAVATLDMYESFIARYFEAPATDRKPRNKREGPYLGPRIGPARLDKLAPLDVQAFYNGLAENGLGAARIRRVHGMLHAALNQAVKWGAISRNPAGLVDLPKVRKPEIKSLDPEVVGRFLNSAAIDRHAALWSLMLETGVRPGEALSLRWRDVDLKVGTAVISRSMTWRAKGEYVFSGTKTGATRPIPLSAELVASLKEHRRAQVEERLAAGPAWVHEDLVFATESGTPHRRENLIKRHLKPILKAAGLPEGLTLYSLRHSCATLALSQGLHPKVVAERLGHASVKHTLDTYSHVTATMQERATETLAGILYRN